MVEHSPQILASEEKATTVKIIIVVVVVVVAKCMATVLVPLITLVLFTIPYPNCLFDRRQM